jgi:hypothetical protein
LDVPTSTNTLASNADAVPGLKGDGIATLFYSHRLATRSSTRPA